MKTAFEKKKKKKIQKNQQMSKKHAKLPSMQRIKGIREW